MTGINKNGVAMQSQTVSNQQRQAVKTPQGQVVYTPKELSIRDEFVKQHKKNGLVERLYNKIKNLTKLGTGSKKAEAAVAKAENGEITEEEARKTIDKYRKSQVNSAQAATDVLSVGAAGLSYFGIRNWIRKKAAESAINEELIKNSKGNILRNIPLFDEKNWLELSKNKTKVVKYATIGAITAGALVKWATSKLNRIGSKEFKIDKKDYNNLKTPMDKQMYKADKKAMRKTRFKANMRNLAGGALNGLMMPLSMVGGAFVGVPLYLTGNSLNRYFVSNHEEKNKSFNGYVENLKNDSITHALTAAAIAIPMAKKVNFTKVFDVNLDKAVKRLKNAELTIPEFSRRTTYNELDDILMSEKEIQSIIHDPDLSIQEKITKLTDENIFAVKFKQISGDNSAITKGLREDCPPTRCFLKEDGKTWDLTEIQTYVNKNLDAGYKVKQCLGVGTIAETYLVTDPSGKDVCIKVIKKGISADKINADKAKFVKMIENLGPEYTSEHKQILLKNIDDLADGILQEVDLQSEFNAAQKLAEHTKVANVVKPIAVKNGIYIMEKANGISLESLVELNLAYSIKDAITNKTLFKDSLLYSIPKDSKLDRLLKGVKDDKQRLEIIEKYINKVESKTPEFGDIKLNQKDFKFLIEEYQHVLAEQFNQVKKGGKVVHADIHPGNIFIDVKALRGRKDNIITQTRANLGYRSPAKIFTLIDTGNTISQSAQEAIDSINLTSYVERGNYKDLAAYVTKGCKGKHSEAEMTKIVEEELKKLFLDDKTYLGPVTNDDILSIASSIMRDNGVIPANTQLNLNKAKHSANNSLEELYGALMCLKIKEVNGVGSLLSMAGGTVKDGTVLNNKYKQLIKNLEKQNLLQMTPEQANKFRKNPNMPAKNSEEYLFYKLKQKKELPIRESEFPDIF